MARILDNWLDTFLEWTKPRSEAPDSLLIWSGLFAVGSVVKRNICFPREFMGSYDIYPNLYIVFVGKAGAIKKSTTAGYAQKLLQKTGDIFLGPTAGSDSKFVQLLSEQSDGAMTIISSEFANLVKTSQEQMYAFLTQLFDNEPYYDYATRSHKEERITNPYMSILACTTPIWIAHNTAYMMGGGFASRVIFVFEEGPRRRKMYYEDIDIQEIDRLEKTLIDDLRHIMTLKGKFKHENRALLKKMEEWYQSLPEANIADDRTAGYFNRKHSHLHKVMMILSLCERDDLIVTETHFNSALKLLDYVEAKMPRALIATGRNPYAADLHGMRDYIKKAGKKVPRSEIVTQFIHNLTEEQTGQILHALVIMGEIEAFSENNSEYDEPSYRAKRDKV